jgi:hypothetical protein
MNQFLRNLTAEPASQRAVHHRGIGHSVRWPALTVFMLSICASTPATTVQADLSARAAG